ncbi:V-type proton ATPase subunit C [Paenibacillus senegalensis]|uniref:hypothetical protein n=1 Tax=Paenibacillus senegalensis TaxID=1465766 RepID=UPI00028809E4|nr:hypothetical protein [Paenibacillus senegalensis]
MKLRLLPILLTVACSSVILFGGWFVYRSYAMETPLATVVSEAPGVEEADINLTNNFVDIYLKLNQDANLREIYKHIQKEGAGLLAKRELNLHIEEEPSPAIDQWWSRVLFDIAQAMETRNYSAIPVTLEEKSADLPGLEVVTEIDSTNVYVQLTYEGATKYILLPRVPAQLGVWPNEQI